MEGVFDHETPNNAVPSNSDQGHHVASAPPEMEKGPEAGQSQGFDLSELSYELKQAYRVFVELLSDSNRNVTWPFLDPVDAKAQGLWDYHERIKEPMSFAKIGSKFNSSVYTSITEVVCDLRLMLENCYRYNGPDHWVSKLGQKLEKVLEQKLALLNRSLREKVTLTATMALRLNCDVETLNEGLGRRRSGRSYVNMLNGDSSSSIISHLKIQEEFEERERRIQKEKEKKEANEALLQELAEWEVKELTPETIKQLHSMWEIPSVVSLLYILKEFLDLEDINLTELEISFVYPNKSKLLSKVFTALLVTPHQRKSLTKKQPMVFKVWEAKLADRVSSWYKVVELEGPEMAAYRFGLDPDFYNILGESNPLVEKCYHELSLHRRVWLLKCLCDHSVFKDYDIREQLNSLSCADQREWLLGCDADNWSYLYFPLFEPTDLRVYRQCPLPNPPFSDKKWEVSPAPASPATAASKVKKTPSRPATPTPAPRSARLRNRRKSPEPEPEPEQEAKPEQKDENVTAMDVEEECTISPGFEVSCCDVEGLRALCQRFDERPPAAATPKRRGRKPKGAAAGGRKRCEVELREALATLLAELEPHDARFAKAASRAKAKVMKESQEPDPPDKSEEKAPSEDDEDWVSEGSIGEIPLDTSDEEFVLEEEQRAVTVDNVTSRKRKLDEGDEQTFLRTGPIIPGTEQRLSGMGQNIAGRNILSSGQTVPSTKQTFPGNRQIFPGIGQTFPGNYQTLSKPADKIDERPCEIAIQTPPLKLKKRQKISSGVSPSAAPSSGIQASSAAAKLVTAVPPTVNRSALVGDGSLLSIKPMLNTQGKVTVQSIGSGSGPTAGTSAPNPTVLLKQLAPGSTRQIFVVAPGNARPNLQGAQEGLPKSEVTSLDNKGSVTTTPTAVSLRNLGPGKSTPQTLIVSQSNATSAATTVKIVPYPVAASGGASSTSQKTSVISLPAGLLSQQALRGSTTQVVIGGKVMTAIALRGSQITPGQHVGQVASPSPAGNKAESVPKTRPLILGSARSRQTPAVQLAQPSGAATPGASAAVGTSSAAVETSSAAVGTSSAAVGTSSAAVGTSSAAVGTSSAAVGTSSAAVGTSSAAVGTSSAAVGTSSAAVGTSSAVVGTSSGASALSSSVSAISPGTSALSLSVSALGTSTVPSMTTSRSCATSSGSSAMFLGVSTAFSEASITTSGTSTNSRPSTITSVASTTASGPSTEATGAPTIILEVSTTTSGASTVMSVAPATTPGASTITSASSTTPPGASITSPGAPTTTSVAPTTNSGAPTTTSGASTTTPVASTTSSVASTTHSGASTSTPGTSSTCSGASTTFSERCVSPSCPPLGDRRPAEELPRQTCHQTFPPSSSTGQSLVNGHRVVHAAGDAGGQEGVAPTSTVSSSPSVAHPVHSQAPHPSCSGSASQLDLVSLPSGSPQPILVQASSQASDKSIFSSVPLPKAKVDFVSSSAQIFQSTPGVSGTTGGVSTSQEDCVSSTSDHFCEPGEIPARLSGGVSCNRSENVENDVPPAEMVTAFTPGESEVCPIPAAELGSRKCADESPKASEGPSAGASQKDVAKAANGAMTVKAEVAELGTRKCADEAPNAGGSPSAGAGKDVRKVHNSVDAEMIVKHEAGTTSSEERANDSDDYSAMCNGVGGGNSRTSLLAQCSPQDDKHDALCNSTL